MFAVVLLTSLLDPPSVLDVRFAVVGGGTGAIGLYRTTPEGRALAFLEREVPRWATENKCYSCHNNGDAARALYVAARFGRPISRRALEDTSHWLARPAGWDDNGGGGPNSDKKLARLQFEAALAEAVDAGFIKDRTPLTKATAAVAADQEKDGSWSIDTDGSIGSPTTYGTALATHLARRTLHGADPKQFATNIAAADVWLRKVGVRTVLDAAAVLLALEEADDTLATTQREHCLTLLHKGEYKKGGWGPYVNAAPEPFDTAVVLLALSLQPRTLETVRLMRRGRAYLLATQQEDGAWPATTRPPGRESYAQRLSTTGWVTMALLASRQE
jgi:hypothetical protein